MGVVPASFASRHSWRSPARTRAGRSRLRLVWLAVVLLALVWPFPAAATWLVRGDTPAPPPGSVRSQACAPGDSSAPADWPLIVCDNFDTDSGSWPTGISSDELAIVSRFIGGTYAWQAKALQGVFTSVRYGLDSYPDFYAATTAAWMGAAPDARYGLQFRWQDASNFYVLFVHDGTQQFSLQAVFGNNWETLLDWTQSNAIRAGGSNRLAVLAQGPRIVLYINGEQVGEVNDGRIPAGQAGLAIDLTEGQDAALQFDDFELRVPPSAPATHAPEPSPQPVPTTGGWIGGTIPASSCTHGKWLVERGWVRELCDPFTTNQNNWSLGDAADKYGELTRSLTDNTYRWDMRAAENVNPWAAPTQWTFTDFFASVEARQLAGSDSGSYCLVFRKADDNNYYRFAISELQGFRVDALLDGTWNNLMDWSPAPAIRPGDWNQFAVSASGPAFTLYINDQEVATFSDWRLTRGGVGLAVEGSAGQHVAVAFDNFEVVVPAQVPGPDVQPGPTVPAVVTLAPGECARPASAPAGWPVALCEEFLDNRGGWPLGVEMDDYARTERTIAAATYGWDVESYRDVLSWVTYHEQEWSDLYLAVEAMRFAGPPDSTYGLIFRRQESGSYYLFDAGDGWFQVSLYQDGQWETLIEATPHPAVATNDWNRLAVLAEGAHLTFYVNDVQVGELTDSRLAGGRIGMAVSVGPDQQLNVQFGELLVLVPPGGDEPVPTPAPLPTVEPISTPPPLPTDAPVPPPTASPSACERPATVPPGWTLSICETFDDNRNNWPEGIEDDDIAMSDMFVALGTYGWEVEAYDDVFIPTELENAVFSDLYLSVDLPYVDGSEMASLGLLFRRLDRDNYYHLDISADAFMVGIEEDGAWSELISWTETAALNRGAPNRLGVKAEGSHLTFYINDRQVAEWDDASFSSGAVGLSVSVPAGDMLWAEFDNLQVWTPGEETVPPAPLPPAPVPPPTSAFVPEPVTWLTHDDPLGFTLRHPAGWTPQVLQGEQILVRSADGTEFTVVQPFFARDGATAAGWAAEVPEKLAQLFPGATVTDVRQLSAQPDQVIAELSFADRGEPGRALLLCTLDGRSGMLYAVAAPERSFDAVRQTLVDILDTFSFTTPTVPPPDSGGVTYVRWQEPNENAFALEVPQGWTVSGGLVRENALDVRPDVQITSPDGQMFFRIGDRNVPPYTALRWDMEVAGFTEGSWYSYMGMTWMVRSYTSGLDYAREYLTRNLSAGCTDATIVEERDRSDLSQPINAIYGRYNLLGGSMTIDIGQIVAECHRDGQPLYVFCLAGTKRTQISGIDIWNVETLISAIVPTAMRDAGVAILGHIANSYQPNADWVRRQAEVAGEVGDTVARVAGEIREITRQTFEAESAARDNAARRWSNMILGQTDVQDPVTGETWRVANGHNYYWRRGDTVVGTDIDRPNVEFTPLVEY